MASKRTHVCAVVMAAAASAAGAGEHDWWLGEHERGLEAQKMATPILNHPARCMPCQSMYVLTFVGSFRA